MQLFVQTLVISIPDYFNALLPGLSKCANNPLQVLQIEAWTFIWNGKSVFNSQDNIKCTFCWPLCFLRFLNLYDGPSFHSSFPVDWGVQLCLFIYFEIPPTKKKKLPHKQANWFWVVIVSHVRLSSPMTWFCFITYSLIHFSVTN